MSKAKVLRTDFTKATDDKLNEKAEAVRTGLTDHSGDFPSPPVTPSALAILIAAYILKLNLYKRGGLDQKEAFGHAKTALLAALESDADYVDEVADGDAELITNAGYVPTKTTASPKPAPVKITGVKAERGEAVGEIFVECPAQDGAEFYGLLIYQGTAPDSIGFTNGLFSSPSTPTAFAIDVNKSRKKHLQELTPGVRYFFYMYCGNSNGISALSDVVSLMAA